MSVGRERDKQRSIPEQTTKSQFESATDKPPDSPSPNGKQTGATQTTSEGEIHGELRSLGTRLVVFAITAASIVLDLAFVASWVGVHVGSHHLVKKIGTLDGVSGILATALEMAFNTATCSIVLSYIAHDVYVSVRRHWKGRRR